MTRNTGLRRFVAGSGSAPPAARQDQLPPSPAGRPPGPPGPAGLAGLPGGLSGPPGGLSGLPVGLSGPVDSPAGLSGRPAAGTARQATEKCEMCATEIAAEHGHVADLESSTLVCACRACYLLFTAAQAGRGRYCAVPDRYLHDPVRPLPAARWDQFDIPVGLAFFLRSSERGEVTGFYPSPAGATECVLDLQAWDALAADYPMLAAAAPDVEAALICRTNSGVEYFLVPIDACYELAGRMRLHWRGFDGGAEARASIEEFLGNVRSRARAFRQETPDG